MTSQTAEPVTEAPPAPARRTRFSLVMRLYAAAADVKMKDIAKELEISDSMLHCIMEGKRDPGRAFRAMLADWLLEDGL